MDKISPQKKSARVRKTSANKGFWAQKATREARNVIDAFENLLREKSRQQIFGAGVAIAITLIIFFYSLYIGNYLIALIVIAVWVATWKRPRHHIFVEVGKQRYFDQKRKNFRVPRAEHCRQLRINYHDWLEWRMDKDHEFSVRIMTLEAFDLDEWKLASEKLPLNYKTIDLQIWKKQKPNKTVVMSLQEEVHLSLMKFIPLNTWII